MRRYKLKSEQVLVAIGRKRFALERWGYDKKQFHSGLLRIHRGVPTGGFVAMSSWGPLKAKVLGVNASKAWVVSAGVQSEALKKSHGNTIVRWFFGNVEKLARAGGKQSLVARSGFGRHEAELLESMGFRQAGKTEYFVKTL